MELRLNIGLNQIVGLIRNLPYDDKLIIKNQLEMDLKLSKRENNLSLQQLLLSGPVMSLEGYESYKALRKQFNKWTKKLSV